MKITRKNLILFFLLKVTGKYGIEAHKESGHLNSLAEMHYSANIPGNNSLHSTDVRTAGRNKHHGTEMYGSPGSEMGSREHARNNLGANMGLGVEANYYKGNGYGRPGGNLSGEDLGNQKRRLARQSAAGGLGGPAGGNVGGEKRGARSPAEYGEFGGGRSGSAGRNAAERGDLPQSGSGSGRRGYPYSGGGGELSMAQKEGRGATPYTPELYNSTGMNGGLGGEAVKGRSNLENAIRDRLANELADKAARGDPSAQAALARAGNAYGANNSRPADDQVGNNMADLARKGAAAAEGALKAAASPATGGGEGARRRALNSALRDEEAGRAQARENAKARLGQGKPNAGADQAMGDDLLGARGREAAANGAREGDPSAGKALGRMLKPMNPLYGDEGYRPGGGDTPQNDGDRERQARANKAAKDIAADAYANGMPLGEAVKEGQKGGRAQRVGDEAAANALAAGASPEEAALIGEQAAQNELLGEEMSDTAAMNAVAQQEGYEPVYTEQDFNPPGNSSSERAAAEALKSGADAYEAGEAAEEAEKENERARAKQKAAEQAEEEALRDGATPSEAGEAARRAEERAEMENQGNEEGERAGDAAEAAALADGMPPDEARKAGEQAAAEAKRGFMEGLDNGELEEAAAEEEAKKERERAAAEEDFLNDTYMKAGEAAKQQALADGADYDDAKNLGELAGREAAAKQAGDYAAKKAAADGAGLGKATEAGNAAAKQAYNRNYPPLYDTGDEEAEEKAREEAAKEAGIRERQKAEEGEKEEFEEKSEVEEEEKEKEKEKMRYTDPEEQYKDGIIGEIPDTADKVDVTEGKMKLPLKTFKSNKPKNEEEADAKKERDGLSDKLRNKITKTPQDSRLNTIDGEDGSYNIPESAKSVDIDDGMLFYPKRAKENMEKQGIDTSPLKPKYNLGERKNIPKGEEYYYVPIKNMKMELPSPFNKSPEPLLTNDDDVVDANDADEIYIKKGKVNLVPWNEYTKKMRPNLYQPDEGVPKERSKIVEGEVITNPSGKQYVRLYPKLGVPEEIPLSDLMKKIKDPLESDENSGQDGISKFSKPEKKKPLTSLNVGTNTGTDSKKFEKNYPEKLKESIKENPLIKDIPSDKNAFNKCPKTSIMILKSKDDKEEAKKKCPSNKTFEKLVKKVLAENSNKFSKTLNMDEVRFNSLVKVIPKKVYKVLFDYDCKINDESFKKNYLENVKPLKTIFKSYTDAFIPLIKGAIRVARLRFKPYTITTRIVKKPQTIKFKKYPNMKNIKRNPPLIKKKVKITRPKPITVEKKVTVPVKEVNITKTPLV